MHNHACTYDKLHGFEGSLWGTANHNSTCIEQKQYFVIMCECSLCIGSAMLAVCYGSQFYPPKETKLPSSAKIVRRIPRVYPGLSSGIFMPVPGIPGMKSPFCCFSNVSECATAY